MGKSTHLAECRDWRGYYDMLMADNPPADIAGARAVLVWLLGENLPTEEEREN